jgi:1-acyl-sn-glycerol-3-phosphate acyltransferase
MEFKGGIFAMATKTDVPIVPITLSHTHAVMPGNSLFPVQPGWGKLHVHVHDPIVATGKTEAELADLVRASFLKTLPLEQHPLEYISTEEALQTLSNQQSASSENKSSSVSV